MTSRRPRDLQAERATLRAAAARLLDGTPLRSESGRLTVTELLHESDLRRDVVYGDHKDLVEEFQSQVRAQGRTPALSRSLADENAELKQKLAETAAALAGERQVSATLRRLVAELDLELHAARAGTGPASITSLPARRRPARGR
jgi:hypothetical protein